MADPKLIITLRQKNIPGMKNSKNKSDSAITTEDYQSITQRYKDFWA